MVNGAIKCGSGAEDKNNSLALVSLMESALSPIVLVHARLCPAVDLCGLMMIMMMFYVEFKFFVTARIPFLACPQQNLARQIVLLTFHIRIPTVS